MIEVKKNLEDELRCALIEAKKSIEGKRKLNTLDNCSSKTILLLSFSIL